MNKQRIGVVQDTACRPNGDIKQWNHPQPVYQLNLGTGMEKIPNPQPTRQSTIDQFLSRGNTFTNR